MADFLGIHNAETPTPAFVYGGDLRSLRRYLASSFCNRREVVPEVLLGVACGLEYLHTKGLVHMELTQDTITVHDVGGDNPCILRIIENLIHVHVHTLIRTACMQHN